MNMQYRDVMLPQIAVVERAVKGRIYPEGTVYIQVSACRRSHLEQFNRLETAGELENKYAAIIPKVPALPEYLWITLNKSAQEFMERFVGKNINIQMESFDCFSLQWHDDLKAQQIVADMVTQVEHEIRETECEMEMIKTAKEWFLATMFV